MVLIQQRWRQAAKAAALALEQRGAEHRYGGEDDGPLRARAGRGCDHQRRRWRAEPWDALRQTQVNRILHHVSARAAHDQERPAQQRGLTPVRACAAAGLKGARAAALRPVVAAARRLAAAVPRLIEEPREEDERPADRVQHKVNSKVVHERRVLRIAPRMDD